MAAVGCLVAACASDATITADEAHPTSFAELARSFPAAAALARDAVPPTKTVDERTWVLRTNERRPPAKAAWRRIDRPLGAWAGVHADEPIVLSAAGQPSIAVRRRGARPTTGRVDGGAIVYGDAFPRADAILFAREDGIEELAIARSSAAKIAYDFELPDGWTLLAGVAGLVEARDRDGRARLRTWVRNAWDRTGAAVRVEPVVRGRSIEIEVRGNPRWPVAIDPLWTSTAQTMSPRAYAAAALLPTGAVLVAGGTTAPITLEIFDPVTETFSLANPATPLPVESARQALVATRSGVAILAGGVSIAPQPVFPVSFAIPSFGPSAYAPTKANEAPELAGAVAGVRYGDGAFFAGPGGAVQLGAWDGMFAFAQPFEDASSGRDGVALTVLPDGSVLGTGGVPKGDAMPTTTNARWLAAVGASGGSLQIGRARHTATLLGDGRVLVAGGESALGDPTTALASLELGTAQGSSYSFETLGSSLATARFDHMAVRLASGDVLFVGGAASTEIFRVATGAVEAAGDLTTVRHGPAVTMLPSGRVLAIGGTPAPDDESKALTSADVYAPGGAWAETFGWLTTPSSSPTATALPDGRIVVIGADAEVFDAVASQSATPVPLPAERIGHTSTLLPDGRVFVAGGDGVGTSTLLFDPSTLTVVPGPALSTARSGHVAVALPDGRVLLVGGNTAPPDYEIYDPATGQLASGGNFSLLRGAGHVRPIAALLGATWGSWANKVLVVGDEASGGEAPEVWDPATGSASPLAMKKSSVGRQRGLGVVLSGGDLLLASGQLGGAPVSIVERLAPDGFHVVGSSVQPHSDGTLTAFSKGGAILAGASLAASTTVPWAELYDEKNDVLVQPAQLAQAFAPVGGQAAVWDDVVGKAFFVGGRMQSGGVTAPVPVVQTFDPSTQTLARADDPMLVPRQQHVLVRTPSGKILVAGGVDASGAPTKDTLLLDDVGAASAWVGLPETRISPTATPLDDGSVLLTGGSDVPNGTVYASAARVAEDGSVGTVAMNAPRMGHAAVRLGPERVLVVGGVSGTGGGAQWRSDAEIFDGSTFATVPASLPMPSPAPAAARVGDGRVAMVDPKGGVVPIVVFDPTTGAFSTASANGPTNKDRAVGLATEAGAFLFFEALGTGMPMIGSWSPEKSATFQDDGVLMPVSATSLPTGDVVACGIACVIVNPAVPSVLESVDFVTADPAVPLVTGDVLRYGVARAILHTSPRGVVRPTITSVTPADPEIDTGTIVIAGSGFDHPTSASSSGLATSPVQATLPPIVRFVPDEGGPTTLPVTSWSDGEVHAAIPFTSYPGGGFVHVLVDGVPSAGARMRIAGHALGAMCKTDTSCASGYCRGNRCCDTACNGACEDCSTGTCGVAPAGADPGQLCATAMTTMECIAPFCGANGTCAPLADQTPCMNGAGRCVAGVCTVGAICVGNSVTTPTGSKPCDPYACVNGACTSTCTGDEGCVGAGFGCGPTTHKCGSCTGPSSVDLGGGIVQGCGRYVCKDHECASSCAGDGDCTAGWKCVNGACSAYCDDATNEPIAGAAQPKCDPFRCVAGACTAACKADGDCADGYRCDTATGACAAFCDAQNRPVHGTIDPPCDPYVCRAGACATTCADDGGCIAGWRCLHGSCATCSADRTKAIVGSATTACGGNLLCKDGACPTACASDGDCRDGFACTAGVCSACSDDGTSSIQGDVQRSCGDYVCRAGRCLDACSGDADCAAGLQCANGKCSGVCDDTGTHALSRGGSIACAPFVCRSGVCLTSCSSNVDCAEGLVCDQGRCAEPSFDTTLTDPGACATTPGGSREAPWLPLASVVAAFVAAARRRRNA